MTDFLKLFMGNNRSDPTEHKCWCETCRPMTWEDQRFIVCPDCGNKRCPRASNHIYKCTGSNATGQVGELEESSEGTVRAGYIGGPPISADDPELKG